MADGTGRDSYILAQNGGFFNTYKPNNFGNELRDYEVIQKPRFGKDHREFEDYQRWFN